MPKKKSEKKVKKEKSNKEKICEIFSIEKDGEEKTIRVCNDEEKGDGKKQTQMQNKQLKTILLVTAGIMLAIIIMFYIISSIRQFEYRGIKFETVKEGDLIFYRTIFHLYSPEGKNTADYSVYLRKNPRLLKDVPFNGEINLKSNLVMEIKEDFNCEGDEIIALANMNNFLGGPLFKMNLVKNESYGCDSEGRYMFLKLESGNETRIDQFGPACYSLKINNCEILEATEKFMTEIMVDINREQITIK